MPLGEHPGVKVLHRPCLTAGPRLSGACRADQMPPRPRLNSGEPDPVAGEPHPAGDVVGRDHVVAVDAEYDVAVCVERFIADACSVLQGRPLCFVCPAHDLGPGLGEVDEDHDRLLEVRILLKSHFRGR